jgi:hypothetical protein
MTLGYNTRVYFYLYEIPGYNKTSKESSEAAVDVH